MITTTNFKTLLEHLNFEKNKNDIYVKKIDRVTSLKVDFKNNYEDEFNFSQTFSRYKDYESGQNFSEIEEVLMNEITNEIIEDIFNKSVVNW